uniref:Cytochrome b561 and DOMON domain-containing protein n=1 Tax=Cannabis sativa TaxID=3483 RepID=A0A803QMQ9_CANSA
MASHRLLKLKDKNELISYYTSPHFSHHFFPQTTSIRFFDFYKLGSKDAIDKERARLADEMNRGYFADISELKKHGGKIALASKIIIPEMKAVKFPSIEVNFSNGKALKLPIDLKEKENAADAAKSSPIPKASLICVSFRANAQSMISSWSLPFLDTFRSSKGVNLYEYTQNEDNVMNIVLSAVYTTGWVGIGFSKDGMMVGSSAIVGWVTKKGQARVKQFYLQGSRKSQVIADKGELPLTGIPSSVVLHGPRIYLAFQLKFEKQPLHHQPLILAFGFSYPNHLHLSHHDDKTTIMFDFNAGSASDAPSDVGKMKKNHGILAILGWGLILPFGAIIPRYFKHKDPVWYYLHSVIQLVGFVFGLAAVVLGQQLYNKIGAHFPTHRGIGIFILVLSILQILAFFLRPNKEAKIRRYWNWYHHSMGRLALLFGALNIVLGMQIGGAGNDWKIGYGFVLGIVLLSVIVLETLKWIKKSEEKKMASTFQMDPVQ